ncbi:MAG: hypothetical protein ACHQK9_06520 [Reyranellales bacterium]
MPSTTFAYRATIGLIWALAIWHSWTCRGLFVDGSAFLVEIVRREWFFRFYPPRIYAMIAGQIPVMTAVTLGVTDLHWLARLLSLGLFSLPTIFYHLALHRAKGDGVLMATIIAAIAMVFMTTGFFIVGEYNTAYAVVILVAVRLVTADRLTLADGIVLAALAAFATRTYETMIYLGPLMAAMILWALRRAPSRPLVATLLHLLAAALFLKGMWVAIDSVLHPHNMEHLEETAQTASNFWQNMQFDLTFGAALVVVVWALVRPDDLLKARPYQWAGVCLAALALSPLLALSDTLVRPLAKSQYVARTVSGLVIATMVAFIWARRSELGGRLRALTLLQRPGAARRFLGFACLMLVAVVPSDLFLTQTWVSYLEAMRTAVRTHSGVIAFEDTSLARRPHFLLVENWMLSSQSLLLRSKRDDAIMQPPRDFTEWVPFTPLEPPNTGRFFWRE